MKVLDGSEKAVDSPLFAFQVVLQIDGVVDSVVIVKEVDRVVLHLVVAADSVEPMDVVPAAVLAGSAVTVKVGVDNEVSQVDLDSEVGQVPETGLSLAFLVAGDSDLVVPLEVLGVVGNAMIVEDTAHRDAFQEEDCSTADGLLKVVVAVLGHSDLDHLELPKINLTNYNSFIIQK